MLPWSLLSLLWLLVAKVAAAALKTDPANKSALLSLRNDLDNVTPWLSSWVETSDPCIDEWRGVLCDCSPVTEECSVTLLDLANLNIGYEKLSGTLSPAIGNLTELRAFILYDSWVTGSIPESVGNLKKLESLWLGSNNFTGSLPPWLFDLPRLRSVDLSENNLTGNIPREWTDVEDGRELKITVRSNEYLCGGIPPLLESFITFDDTNLFNTSGLNLTKQQDIDKRSEQCCSTESIPCEKDDCWVVTEMYCTNNTVMNVYFYGFNMSSAISYSVVHHKVGECAPCNSEDLELYPVDRQEVTQSTVPLTIGGKPYTNYWAYTIYLQESMDDKTSYYVGLVASEQGTCPNKRACQYSRNVCLVVADGEAPSSPSEPSLIVHDNTAQGDGLFDVFVQLDDPFYNCNSPPCTYFWQLADVTSGLNSIVIVLPPRGQYGQLDSANAMWLGQYDNFDGNISASNVALVKGHSYIAIVYAKNQVANLVGSASSDAYYVVTDGSGGSSHLGIALSLGAGITIVVVMLLIGLYSHIRWMIESRKQRKRSQQMQYFRAVLKSSAQAWGDPTCCDDGAARVRRRRKWAIGELQEVALVITDLQDSTPMANTNLKAYRVIQDIHDQIMREHIDMCVGCELNTEGDSFHIAFPTVAAAIRFCMGVQYALMDVEWPKKVLRLASASEVLQGCDVVFRGPRVRMGINWATPGTVGVREHQLTKTWVFSGPAFNAVHELGDAASGGQVLMTEFAWQQLHGHMAEAGFPTLRQLGLFKLESCSTPMWIYEAQQQLGRPLPRTFPPPRMLVMQAEGYGFHIVPPCSPNDSGQLAFVAVALDFSWFVDDSPPPWLHSRLSNILLIIAMQFEGYMFHTDSQICSYLLAFPEALPALFFCHAAQLALLYEQWPCKATEFGPKEKSWDGKLLFHGPRCAMAVHTTTAFKQLTNDDTPGSLGEAKRTDKLYVGGGLQFLQEVAQVAHGGQVVVTENAWRDVKDNLPSNVTFYHLGTHVLSDDFPEPQMLMEVMPALMARRSFPPLVSQWMATPGYRESPDPANDMAILFVICSKPSEVVAAQKLTHDELLKAGCSTLASYRSAILMYEELVEQLLVQYNGYKCKEPEPGKFTLAFGVLEDAVIFMATLQRRLLDLPWPEEVLKWKECRGVLGPGEQALWRGLRVKAGCAYGRPDHRKPLNTGRADYFGPLANLAARVCALAGPGQALVESSGVDRCPLVDEDMVQPDRCSRSTKGPVACRCLGIPTEADYVLLRPYGWFLLKGFDDERLLYDVSTLELQDRYTAGVGALHEKLQTSGVRESFSAQVMRPLRHALASPLDNSALNAMDDVVKRSKSSFHKLVRRSFVPKRSSSSIHKRRSHLHNSFTESGFTTSASDDFNCAPDGIEMPQSRCASLTSRNSSGSIKVNPFRDASTDAAFLETYEETNEETNEETEKTHSQIMGSVQEEFSSPFTHASSWTRRSVSAQDLRLSPDGGEALGSSAGSQPGTVPCSLTPLRRCVSSPATLVHAVNSPLDSSSAANLVARLLSTKRRASQPVARSVRFENGHTVIQLDDERGDGRGGNGAGVQRVRTSRGVLKRTSFDIERGPAQAASTAHDSDADGHAGVNGDGEGWRHGALEPRNSRQSATQFSTVTAISHHSLGQNLRELLGWLSPTRSFSAGDGVASRPVSVSLPAGRDWGRHPYTTATEGRVQSVESKAAGKVAASAPTEASLSRVRSILSFRKQPSVAGRDHVELPASLYGTDGGAATF